MRRIATLEIYTDEDAERLGVDDLLITLAQQEVVAAQIGQKGYAVPESLLDSIASCDRQLEVKKAADKARRLKALKAQRTALATVTERRQTLDEEIAALEGKTQAANA